MKLIMDDKSNYALSTLVYVLRLAREGEFNPLLKMGLTENQIHELLTLNNEEIHDMAAIAKANFLTVQFDTEALAVALKLKVVKSQRRIEIFEMLEAGASYPVMKHLYGLTSENIANFRRINNIQRNEGRPAHASESEEEELWQLLKHKSDKGLESKDLPLRLLDAHEKTGVRIDTIWILIKQWWGQQPEQATN